MPDVFGGHTQIHVAKVRNKSAGSVGRHLLRYERYCGRYEDDVDSDLQLMTMRAARRKFPPPPPPQNV